MMRIIFDFIHHANFYLKLILSVGNIDYIIIYILFVIEEDFCVVIKNKFIERILKSNIYLQKVTASHEYIRSFSYFSRGTTRLQNIVSNSLIIRLIKTSLI